MFALLSLISLPNFAHFGFRCRFCPFFHFGRRRRNFQTCDRRETKMCSDKQERRIQFMLPLTVAHPVARCTRRLCSRRHRLCRGALRAWREHRDHRGVSVRLSVDCVACVTPMRHPQAETQYPTEMAPPLAADIIHPAAGSAKSGTFRAWLAKICQTKSIKNRRGRKGERMK